MKNPADDHSFENLGKMHSDIVYLSNGIHSRKVKIKKLSDDIEKETIRLTEQGYDMKTLKVIIVEGIEK